MDYYRIDFMLRDTRTGKVSKRKHRIYTSYKSFDYNWNYHTSYIPMEHKAGWDTWIVGYENDTQIRRYPKEGD